MLRSRSDTISIGREGNDVNFPDDPYISGHHAEITLPLNVNNVAATAQPAGPLIIPTSQAGEPVQPTPDQGTKAGGSDGQAGETIVECRDLTQNRKTTSACSICQISRCDPKLPGLALAAVTKTPRGLRCRDQSWRG